MGRREIQRAFQDIASGDLSNPAGFTSLPAGTVDKTDTYSVIVNWTGGTAVNGTLDVQARIGEPNVDAPGVITPWISLGFGSPITISAASGNHEIFITGFTQYRYVYTYIAGSAGTLIVTHTATTVGA